MTETIMDPSELERVRALFKPLLRRGEVVALCSEFGYCEGAARKLIEGATAPLQPIDARLLPGRRRDRRDEILLQLNGGRDVRDVRD
jgi:hypothetical protein